MARLALPELPDQFHRLEEEHPSGWRPAGRPRSPASHESSHLAGREGHPGRERPRSDDPGPDGHRHPGHVDRPVRLRPPPVRGARAVHGARRHRRPRADGRRRGGRRRGPATSTSATAWSSRSTSAAGTAGCASATSRASARRRRTSSTAPARACSATASSTGRCRAARRSTSASRTRDYGAIKVPERAARRPVPVPERRAAHRLAGRRVRRRAGRRHAAGHRGRADRRHGRPGSRCTEGCGSSWPTWCRSVSTGSRPAAPR